MQCRFEGLFRHKVLFKSRTSVLFQKLVLGRVFRVLYSKARVVLQDVGKSCTAPYHDRVAAGSDDDALVRSFAELVGIGLCDQPR